MKTTLLSRGNKALFRKSLIAYLFLFPALAIYTVIILFPSANTVFLSLMKWDGLNPIKVFVGFANYAKALNDGRFHGAFVNNLIWLVMLISVPIIISILLAVAVTAKSIRGRDQFQAIYFVPYVLSPVVVALVWRWIYSPRIGLLSGLLRAFHIVSRPYGVLGDPKFALQSLIFTHMWMLFGFCTVIYVNALQNIERDLYDAAMIDGANAFQRFIYITLPGVSTVTTFLIMLNMINSFKVFNQVYLMTQGGPVNSTEVVAYYMFNQAFRMNYVGYGSAIAVLLSIVILAVGIFFITLRERNSAQ
jgi:ABC-type sugar transport system permease subunit